MLTIDYERLDVAEGHVVLDLGCGKGRHSYEVQRRGGRVVAADLDIDALRATAEMMLAVSYEEDVPLGSACVADALQLPFASASFDRVIASEVLEHIPADGAALEEIARIVKPGGTVAVSVPRFWPELICWGLSGDYRTSEGGHVRIYRRSQMVERMRAAGLEPFAVHHAHAFHAPYWWMRCAFGLQREQILPARSYHRFLVWDIENPNKVVRSIEKGLDPVLGKSVVFYARRVAVPAHA